MKYPSHKSLHFIKSLGFTICVAALVVSFAGPLSAWQKKTGEQTKRPKINDAKNTKTGQPEPEKDPVFEQYGIYGNKAPRAASIEPVATTLPLKIDAETRIALIGNSLFEREQDFGQFETLLQKMYPEHRLTVRNLAWSGDEINLQPRPDNFADLEQHLTYEKIDLIFAAYGFNESFAGEAGLTEFPEELKPVFTGSEIQSVQRHRPHHRLFCSHRSRMKILMVSQRLI